MKKWSGITVLLYLLAGTAFLHGEIFPNSGIEKKYVSSVWVADNGDGTYKNPILHADYSDPDVIAAGNDFYMTASSFNCSPGLPILHSKDLVNWKIVNHALRRLPADDGRYDIPQHGKGVWAPSIRKHEDEFYIYWGDPDFGVYMVKTKDPLGDWDEPVLVLPGNGIIDSSPLWDDDGKAWLVTGWAASRAKVNSVLTVWPMSADGSKVIGEGRHVFDGHDENRTVEGPKLYKINGYYYILAPAGGVPTGWQLVMRSKNVYGPYEYRTVLAQGNTEINGPHQGGLVSTASGQWWFMHFQDKEAYGRIVHLQPVEWRDDWPVIGADPDGDGCGEPVLSYAKPDVSEAGEICTPFESDEFENGQFGPQWQWAANYKITWWVPLPGRDFLRLLAYPRMFGNGSIWDSPNILMQKFPAPEFTATTKLKLVVDKADRNGKTAGAGMVVMGNDYSYLLFTKDKEGYRLDQVNCLAANKYVTEHVIDSARLKDNEITLRVKVSAPEAVCTFAYSEDGEQFTDFGKPHTAKPEMWIGAKIGLFCVTVPGLNGGYADFDYFSVTD